MLKKIFISISLIIFLTFGPLSAFAGGTNTAVSPQESIYNDRVAQCISEGHVPEKFKQNLSRPITVGEYAELYFSVNKDFWEDDMLNKIKIISSSINDNSPEYLKEAFITGMINNSDDLNKTMTKEEAALRFVQPYMNLNNRALDVPTTDYNSISPDSMEAVGYMIGEQVIPTLNNKFLPQDLFTVEQALCGANTPTFEYIQGIIPLYSLSKASSIIVEKNRVTVSFLSSKDSEDYICSNIIPLLNDLDVSGQYQRFDVGYMIIELNGPDYSIRFTLKNNLCNARILHFFNI